LSVALRTELDDELLDEGLVRELVHKVQNLRRDLRFQIEAPIAVRLAGSERLETLLKGRWGQYFESEVLARTLEIGVEPGEEARALSVDGEVLRVDLKPVE
ncbi:MAG: DUF5915 domain-containing protein, partial [Rubrobacteraceae bacterium]